MKTAILLILILSSHAHARIWTNFAQTKTFEAELLSIDTATSPISITVRNEADKLLKFSINILSQGDQNYVLAKIQPTLGIAIVSLTKLQVSWQEFTGETWVVQFSPNLRDPWISIATSPTPSGANRSLELSRTSSRGFYRLIKE